VQWLAILEVQERARRISSFIRIEKVIKAHGGWPIK